MTRYVDVSQMSAMIRDIGPENMIEAIARYIKEDYLRWDDFDKTARVATHSKLGVIELMPIADNRLYAFKYVNGHPANTRQGKLTVMAFGVLADVATGYPLLLSEMTIATALRTAAMSALAARTLARPNSQSMAIIGNGAQSEFQVLGFYKLLGIREFLAYDIDSAATQRLIHNLEHYADISITAPSSVAQAVQGADIVTTITADKTFATVLTPDLIVPGVHINAVGGDCPGKTELHSQILLEGKVFVEYAKQSRIEGEIQRLPDDFPVTEFWEVLSHSKAGRTSPDEVTIFDSVGFALEDYSTLRYLYDLVAATDSDTLNLIPTLPDPKNLFGAAMDLAAPAAVLATGAFT
ncbi:MAG: ornithine cyclodeaminase [Burkholderiaceae bacterium]|nr:ornithine cyclodeaminase [Burkholderiaceae bacterium]